MTASELMDRRETGTRNPKIAFHLEPEMKALVKEAAWDARQSMSQWVRDAIAARLVAEMPVDDL